MHPLRANTLKDYGNFCLHFGLASTVSAGAFLALGVPPVLSAIALGVTAAAHFGLEPALRQAFQGAINAEKKRNLKVQNETELVPSAHNPDLYVLERSRDPRFFEKVRLWIGDFAQRLDIKEEPNLLIMPPSDGFKRKSKKKDTLKGSLRDFLRTTFNEKANAFAFSHERGNVVLNNPIVNALDERELKGVVAHEMVHLGAKHTFTSKPLSAVSTPAKILTSLNRLVTTFSSFKNFGLVLAAGAGADYAGDRIAAYKGWDEEDTQDKAKIKTLKRCLSNIGLLGLGVVFQAPDLLVAQAIDLGTRASLFLIGKRHSRCNEFQADRVAGELTGDPEALSSALKKIRMLNMPKNAPDHSEKSPLSGIFDRVRDLAKTHPNVERRSARLNDMDVNPIPQRLSFYMT